MIIGETIIAEIVELSINATTVFTPWFPRQGNNLTSSFEVIAIGGVESPELFLSLYHKNSEDTGDGSANSSVTGTTSRQTVGVSSFRNTDCKELVRYKVTLSTMLEPGEDGLMYAHFRILNPSWETTGAQGI